MARPQKKEINLTQESILALMQEIYNELVEQRNTALRIQNKMLSMMNQTEDMTVLGPIIKEQEKTNSSKESFTLSDLDVDDEVIKSLMEKDLSKMDESYKMKK